MNFPFLASIIVFLLVLGRILKKNTKAMQEEQQSFWQKEHESNNVRKKPLDDLEYITIPSDKLPLQAHHEDAVIRECVVIVHTLTECKIVNLTGITNTDLKLTYGTANITALSEYDQNYTLLVTTLQKWAERLFALGDLDAAKIVLEYAVSIKSDVTKTYLLLAEIYKTQGAVDRITNLLSSADSLTTPSGKVILRKLKEAYPSL